MMEPLPYVNYIDISLNVSPFVEYLNLSLLKFYLFICRTIIHQRLKEKEIERREVGKSVAEQKKKREEESLRQHAEGLRRQKLNQRAELEAIKYGTNPIMVI